MAYDLFRRKQIPRNIALHATLTTSDVVNAPTPASDADKAYLAKLAVTKINAEAGNKKAIKDWKLAKQNIAKLVMKAKRGDKGAQHTVAIIRESGLFQGMTVMSVSGNDGFNPQELKFIAMITNLKMKAAQGNPRAVKLAQAVGLPIEGPAKL
jgi:pyocin large subunit-like protein